MTLIDLTPGHDDIDVEEDPRDLADDDALCTRQQYAPRRPRTTVRFDGRVYTVQEFRAWVRRLKDVETSTDPAKAHVVEQMRQQLRQQEETASGIVGVLSKRDRDLWEELQRVKAERDALIAEKASQP